MRQNLDQFKHYFLSVLVSLCLIFQLPVYAQNAPMSMDEASYAMQMQTTSPQGSSHNETPVPTDPNASFHGNGGITNGQTDEEKQREQDQKDAADLTDPPPANRGCTGSDPSNRTCYSNAGRIKTTTSTTFVGNFLNFKRVGITTTSHWDPTDGGSYEFFEKRTVTTERKHEKKEHGFSDTLITITEGVDANGNETKREEEDVIEQYEVYKVVEFKKEFIRNGQKVWLPVKMKRLVESVNTHKKWVDRELASAEGTEYRLSASSLSIMETFIKYTLKDDRSGYVMHHRNRFMFYGTALTDAHCTETINNRTVYDGSCPWYSYRDNN